MVEFRPGVPTAVFARLGADLQARGRIALAPLADGIVRKAKANASVGQHPLGTPTPSPGRPQGPSRISFTLVRSIDRTPVVRFGRGWLCQVGVEKGHIPWYHKIESSEYAKFLELYGVHGHGQFPFLYPAAEQGFAILAPEIYNRMYGSGWTRLA